MVFMTSDSHVIPPQLLASGASPLYPHVAKAFSSQQIKEVKAKFEEVKELGQAAAEEWVKGLEAHGKCLLADASRWEKWYLAGGVLQMRTSRQSPQALVHKAEAAPPAVIPDARDSLNTLQKSGGADS